MKRNVFIVWTGSVLSIANPRQGFSIPILPLPKEKWKTNIINGFPFIEFIINLSAAPP